MYSIVFWPACGHITVVGASDRGRLAGRSDGGVEIGTTLRPGDANLKAQIVKGATGGSKRAGREICATSQAACLPAEFACSKGGGEVRARIRIGLSLSWSKLTLSKLGKAQKQSSVFQFSRVESVSCRVVPWQRGSACACQTQLCSSDLLQRPWNASYVPKILVP